MSYEASVQFKFSCSYINVEGALPPILLIEHIYRPMKKQPTIDDVHTLFFVFRVGVRLHI